MKNWMRFLFRSLLLVLLVTLFIIPYNVQACDPPPPQTDNVGGGSWNNGTEISVDLEANPPPDWLQLVGSAVKVTTSGTICHSFRGAQYGWTSQVRKLVNGTWVKISSTSYQTSSESPITVCSKAYSGNTYALFAYYSGD